MKKQRWLGPAVGLMVAAFAICLPVILPVLAALEALYYRRMRAAARKFACLSCGKYLDSEAIRLANEAWLEYFSGKQVNNPNLRFRTSMRRTVRHLRAICPNCSRRYDYAERERTFVASGNNT